MSSDHSGPLPERRETGGEIDLDDVEIVRPSMIANPKRPAWHPEALHSESIRLAHVAATLENLEELFAPEYQPRIIEYRAQPPG